MLQCVHSAKFEIFLMRCVEPYLIAFGTGMHYSVMQELVSNLRDALRKNKLEKIQTLTESFDPPLKII